MAFDLASGEWQTLPEAPIAPRAGGVAGGVGGELVIYGGHTQAPEGGGFEYLNEGAAYNPGTGEWRAIAASPLPPLSGIHGVVIGDELVVFGGQAADVDDDEWSTQVVAYDPGADQ